MYKRDIVVGSTTWRHKDRILLREYVGSDYKIKIDPKKIGYGNVD
jgi:hypothetical protein